MSQSESTGPGPAPSDKPVTVAVTADQMEAAMIASMLADHGIEARTVGDFTAGFRAEAPGGVSVLVHSRDEPRAREAIADARAGRVDGGGERSAAEAEPLVEAGAFTHFDEQGASRVVDVGHKSVTRRKAVASGLVVMEAETLKKISEGGHEKGDVREVARLAGIMAAKRTAELIPLCHPLPLEAIRIELTPHAPTTLRIEATVEVEAKTGVEMEALTAVSIAALTVYDMCKAVDRSMTIERIQLEEKSGGVRGNYRRDAGD